MSEKPDTVPGLGFKDKEKAEETLKVLEGRDPDYQKLAIKGLIGRAKRTLSLTKDKDKVQNINEAVAFFEKWLSEFELNNLSKENRSYLPITIIETLLPLKDKYEIKSEEINNFISAYKDKAKGDYKNLRTISSGEDKPTWDIVRNAALKKLLKQIEENKPDLWKGDLPSKEHMEIILWAYSPDASKLKKNVSLYQEKLGTGKDDEDEESDEERKGKKRKSSSEDEEEESPKKKKSN